MNFEADTIYLKELPAGMRRLAAGSVDLVLTDVRRLSKSPTRAAKPGTEPAAEGLLPFLVDCQRVLNTVNAFFFAEKAQLSTFIGFAEQQGLAWDFYVWEHGQRAHALSTDCSLIISLWERGAYFNPEYKSAFFKKVKHYAGAGPEAGHSKPQALIEELLLQRSRPGDLVLDPLAGHGMVPYVCRLHRRHFLAFEGNPVAYGVARQLMLGQAEDEEDPTAPPSGRRRGNGGSDASQLRMNYG